MTTVRQIIIDAYREGGLVQVGLTPEAEEFEEGLSRFNSLVRSLFSSELGVPLTSVIYGTAGMSDPASIARDSEDIVDQNYLPSNTRLFINVDSAKTIKLPPNPEDGAQLSIIDNLGNFSTYPITLDGNGRRIEGGLSLELDQDRFIGSWFYREDIGEWVKIKDLLANEESPFPMEFDDFLSTALAIRINPRYQATAAPETMKTYTDWRSKFRARYRQTQTVGSESGLLRLSLLRYRYGEFGSAFNFAKGFTING